IHAGIKPPVAWHGCDQFRIEHHLVEDSPFTFESKLLLWSSEHSRHGYFGARSRNSGNADVIDTRPFDKVEALIERRRSFVGKHQGRSFRDVHYAATTNAYYARWQTLGTKNLIADRVDLPRSGFMGVDVNVHDHVLRFERDSPAQRFVFEIVVDDEQHESIVVTAFFFQYSAELIETATAVYGFLNTLEILMHGLWITPSDALLYGSGQCFDFLCGPRDADSERYQPTDYFL